MIENSKMIVDISNLREGESSFIQLPSPRYNRIRVLCNFARLVRRLNSPGSRWIHEFYKELVEHFRPQMERLQDEWSQNIDH